MALSQLEDLNTMTHRKGENKPNFATDCPFILGLSEDLLKAKNTILSALFCSTIIKQDKSKKTGLYFLPLLLISLPKQ